MTTYNTPKFIAAGLLIGLCTPLGFAQRNAGKLVKEVFQTPEVPVLEAVRPPFRSPAGLPALSAVLQNNLLATLEISAARETAQQVLAAQTVARQHALAAQTVARLAPQLNLDEKAQLYVTQQTAPVRQYLDTHDNTWPTYKADKSNDWILRHIRNFMEVEEASAPVAAVQQELIRMRAHSNARSPQEVRALANDMLAYGIVPQRAYLWNRQTHTEDELVLGEDIAFAVAACKVPMENNPWQIVGMAELADQVTTYNHMRRATPLFEGLPETHEEHGIQRSNIPVLTRAEYEEKQLAFAQAHPFEYALAPYRSMYFDVVLPRVFNRLSRLEKEALLFTTPGLETATDTKISAQWYEEDGLRWDLVHPDRALRSFLNQEDTDEFIRRLSGVASKKYQFSFRAPSGENVPFKELPYENQIEFLRWAWAYHHLAPQTVLKILYK